MKKETKKARLQRINYEWLNMLDKKDSVHFNYLFNNPDKEEIGITGVMESMGTKQLTFLMRAFALAYSVGHSECRSNILEDRRFAK